MRLMRTSTRKATSRNVPSGIRKNNSGPNRRSTATVPRSPTLKSNKKSLISTKKERRGLSTVRMIKLELAFKLITPKTTITK